MCLKRSERNDKDMKENTKKPDISSKIKDNFKMQLLVCIILSSIVIVSYMIINGSINNKRLRKYTIVDDISLINMVENLDIEDDKIILRGYAFILERDSIDSSISVFLRNADTGREVWLENEHVDRPDVNAYYDCEYNYGKSGFVASIDNDKLDKDEVYEIIINVDNIDSKEKDNFRTTVSSKQYIQDNKLYSYNPNEFDMPDLSMESDLLKEVFQNGHLCFYQKDAGMYLYQYNDKLYWVVTKDFKFEPDGSTYIICGFYTSQISKLSNTDRQQGVDRLSFYFEEYEYKEENTSPYRVAILNIPKNYPITYMITGIYDEKTEIRTLEKYIHLNTIEYQ